MDSSVAVEGSLAIRGSVAPLKKQLKYFGRIAVKRTVY
jgi:hypothetical protein